MGQKGLDKALSAITEKIDKRLIDKTSALLDGFNGLNDKDIVKKVIEDHLLFRTIVSSEDLEDAIVLETAMFFKDLSEWVSFKLHELIEPHLNKCTDCLYIEDDFSCIKTGFKVNPNFVFKPCFSRKNIP